MTATHTPTPWFVERSGLGIHRYISALIRPGILQEVASCGPTEGPEGSEGNAEFIVRACNAHAELVAALQMAKHIVAREGTKEQADQVFDAIEKATGAPA
jgi:hypothetical protein